ALRILCLVFFLIPVVGPAFAQGGSEPLSWTKKEGQQLFDQGQKEYEAGRYKEAYELFKRARKLAKERPTKLEADRWKLGSRGGLTLKALKKGAKGGNIKGAYRSAERDLELYRDTPIGESFSKFVEELQGKLFTTLEDFESVSGRYSKKFGKSFVKDSKNVRQGKRSLRWEVDKKKKAHVLKITDVPRDLSGYKAVTLWLYFEKGSAPYQLQFLGRGKTTSDYGHQMHNGFFSFQKAHRGWKRVEVPLKQFQLQGEVKWEYIKDFRIEFTSNKKCTVYVDYVALVKG
ncbi:MAG: hypothetical protein V3T77_07440, partial [Planctomycetota bacterium]